MAKRKHNIHSEDGRTALFLAVLDCLYRYNDAEKKAIAETAGCNWTTLYYWCSGRTMNPRIDTLTKVGEALGFEIRLVRNTRLPKPRRGLTLVR